MYPRNASALLRATRRAKRKCIIWSLVILHVTFIGCFWAFQFGFIVRNGEGGKDNRKVNMNSVNDIDGFRVEFIKGSSIVSTEFHTIETITTALDKDFVFLTKRGLNSNKSDAGSNEQNKTESLWCFREGLHDSADDGKLSIVEAKTDTGTGDNDELCKCQNGWHGRDCGQPEVIWRTMFTAKRAFHLPQPQRQQPHKLIYLMDGNFHNVELLELQIKSIDEVVDHFVINVRNGSTKRNDMQTFERKLKSTTNRAKFTVNYCRPQRLSGIDKLDYDLCSPRQAYRTLLKHAIVQRLKPSDIFLYTHDREILNRKALKYFKYYYWANAETVITFRLKYVVYGFYWQHPQATRISGFMSSMATLRTNNPDDLLRKIATGKHPNIVIGDLNHFGGWYCQYCLWPNDLITELRTQQTSKNDLREFSILSKFPQIDVSSVQKLMAQGRMLESNEQLIRIRRHNDKYYAPPYAEHYNWKFDNLLTNIYQTLEQDNDDDNGEYR